MQVRATVKSVRLKCLSRKINGIQGFAIIQQILIVRPDRRRDGEFLKTRATK